MRLQRAHPKKTNAPENKRVEVACVANETRFKTSALKNSCSSKTTRSHGLVTHANAFSGERV
jgi:hypothetical protein